MLAGVAEFDVVNKVNVPVAVVVPMQKLPPLSKKLELPKVVAAVNLGT